MQKIKEKKKEKKEKRKFESLVKFKVLIEAGILCMNDGEIFFSFTKNMQITHFIPPMMTQGFMM